MEYVAQRQIMDESFEYKTTFVLWSKSGEFEIENINKKT